MDILPAARRAFRLLDRHSPILLTGLAVAGTVSTAYLVGKASWVASEIIHDFERKPNGLYIKAGNKERFMLVWKLYIPAAATGVLTVTSILGAQSVNSRRQAALVSGITVAERALVEYQDKAIELFGDKNDQKVRDAVVQDKVNANPQMPSLPILEGKVWCYDVYSGRYFVSNKQEIDDAKNQINAMMINGDDYATLNEFYQIIGLHPTKMGEDMGFSTQNLVDINFSSVLAEGGEPCLAMDFRAFPKQDYHILR